jgi:hypothetical protein
VNIRVAEDARVVVHLQPAEVLVERGRTTGALRCKFCRTVVEHYVTCPGNDDDNTKLWASGDPIVFAWRCRSCDELTDLGPREPLLAIYAQEILRRYGTGSS